MEMPSWVRCAWAICLKDLRVWLCHPVQIVSSLLVPVSYFLVVFLGAQAVSQNPVAVVNLDQGPIGAQMVQAIRDAGVFRVTVVMTSAQAQTLYAHLHVAAIITLPVGLSHAVQTHQLAPIPVQVDNTNLDLTNDIRRSVPDAITTYYQHLGSSSPLQVTIAERDVRQRDVQLYQYSVLPVIILVITVNGIITAGMAATNEFEQRTMTGLLLTPCGRFAIILGKVAAGFIGTDVLATCLLLLGAAFNFTQPQGLGWFSTLSIIALSSLVSAGLGIAVGTWFQRKQVVSYAATLVAVELFALAGGLGVIFFEPQWLQNIAVFDPLTYAIHSLQMAVFYHSLQGVWRDITVLACTAVGAILCGVVALRRNIGTH